MKYYIFRNGRLEGSSELPITSEGCKTFYKEYTPEELKALELGATVDENGEVEISDLVKKKIRLQEIKNILDAYKEEYRDLEDAGTGRSIKEQEKYEYLTVEKEGLLAERKEILDSIES